jgi:hypothetical protein
MTTKKRCQICGTESENYLENVYAPRYFHGLGIMCKVCSDIWVRAITPTELKELDRRAIDKIKVNK